MVWYLVKHMTSFQAIHSSRCFPSRTKHVIMSSHQNAEHHNIPTAACKLFKVWQSSGTWEEQQQMKLAFTKTLRADRLYPV